MSDRTGFAGWWDRLGRGQRAALVVVGGVLALNLGLSGLSSVVGGTPGGPASSSFSTGSDGLRAWAELLARDGHTVDRHRGPLADRPLVAAETVVVVDPVHLTAAEARTYGRFVTGGGRLVLVGAGSAPLLGALTRTRPSTTFGHGYVVPWVPAPEVSGVRRVTGSDRRWTDLGGLVPVAGDDIDPFVAVADVGRGRVVAVADAAVFQNRNLASADNAALSLAVVGPRSRPVVFVESVRTAAASGFDAVPSTWKRAAAAAALALAVGLWSAGARFGPPEPDRRRLRPARKDHVDALAADLARVVRTDAEAVEPLVASTRRSLAELVGAPADASPSALWSAGEAAGFDPSDLAALTHPVADPDHALQVGAVAAARQRADHGMTPVATVPTDPANGGTSP